VFQNPALTRFDNLRRPLASCKHERSGLQSLKHLQISNYAHVKVITGALWSAGLVAADLAALEMHGTGTPLGDPIEVGAALAVLRGSRRPVRLTAAKSRAGHAEPAAGAIGMLQVRFADNCIGKQGPARYALQKCRKGRTFVARQAAGMLSGAASASITSLHVINPHVSSALDAHAASGSAAPWIPRLDGAAPLSTAAGGGPVNGCSAFAFQVILLVPDLPIYLRSRPASVMAGNLG
jgi:hypothetical protein